MYIIENEVSLSLLRPNDCFVFPNGTGKVYRCSKYKPREYKYWCYLVNEKFQDVRGYDVDSERKVFKVLM